MLKNVFVNISIGCIYMFWSNKRKSRNNQAEISGKISTKDPRHMTAKENNYNNAFKVQNVRQYNDSISPHNAYMVLQKKEPHIITAYDSALGGREDQQDCCYVTKSIELSPFRLRRTLAVVCDGMGGLEAGDRASITAVGIMKLAFSKLPTQKVDIPHFFREMLDNIDYEINHWDDLKSDRGAGTTLVAVLIENKRLYWASVGDSSLFIVQDGELKRITRAHNYGMCLKELVSDGKITSREAEEDPQKDALVSYLGMGGLTYTDITTKPYVLKNGDTLLLCTDGVTNTLTDDELLSIVLEYADDAYRCCKVITKAVMDKKREVQDNATVVMIQYVE